MVKWTPPPAASLSTQRGTNTKYILLTLILILPNIATAGAGMAAYLQKQAEYAEWQHHKPFFTRQRNWSREDEASAVRESENAPDEDPYSEDEDSYFYDDEYEIYPEPDEW